MTFITASSSSVANSSFYNTVVYKDRLVSQNEKL